MLLYCLAFFLGGCQLVSRDRFMSAPPSPFCSGQLLVSSRAIVVSDKKVFKLLPQVIIYNIWLERNAHIFRGTSLSPSDFFRVIDRAMSDMLFSFLPSVCFFFIYV
ncbi:unnamed protein product [Eruca vesicaria subsp. sativa]|uniref:Uncharacterized protein n=1 Tax=Eruca vesicaria subsp. sativa TaxID=29727 RepID=A0ABC8LTZ1_ERUVS|nr:unnamed protein product [Eruca vesicaria subsp. sativa]